MGQEQRYSLIFSIQTTRGASRTVASKVFGASLLGVCIRHMPLISLSVIVAAELFYMQSRRLICNGQIKRLTAVVD